MLGFHLQRPVNDWPQAVAKLPAGAVFLSVNDLHLCRDAKLANPGVVTVFRKHTNSQHPSSDQEVNRQLARQYFASFIDGTFWQQELWRYIDIFKEWNEYPMDANHLSWLNAVCWVWRNEYQLRHPNELGNKPLACVSRPIGNDIPLDFARVVDQYDNILSYHNYTPVRHKVVHPGEWQHFSGRWTVNDATFRQAGVTVRWIFTEGGPILHNGNGHPLPNDGWLHPDCLNGDVQAYNSVLSYQIDRISEWNALNGNRAIGGVLFTSGNTGSWDLFELDQPEMNAIADHIREYTPGTVPPPDPQPGDSWQQEIWDESIERQAISLNPNAALQKEIFSDGFTPVESEFWYTPIADGIKRACQAAENVGTGQRRVYYAVIPNWDDVRWFSDPAIFTALASPVEGISMVVTSPFNAPRDYGLHEGIDLKAVSGSTPVRILASADGIVESANMEDDGDYGKYVRLNHGDGVKTWYCHMEDVYVSVGQLIATGQPLGLAGNTGNSSGVHLHLTVQHIGHGLDGYVVDDVVDPAPMLGL